MIELDSVGAIGRYHTFASHLKSMPAVGWMSDKGLKDYDASASKRIEEMRAVDNTIEEMIMKPSEDMRALIGKTFNEGRPAYVRELEFDKRFFPLQRVIQLQREFMTEMVELSSGKKSFARDIDSEMKECEFQGVWESNPRIGTVSIDGREREMRVRNSLDMSLGYLNMCEHELYKQAINANLNIIRIMKNAARQGVEIKNTDIRLRARKGTKAYFNLENVMDGFYFSRANDYSSGFRSMRGLLEGNEYTRGYVLTKEEMTKFLKDETIQ